MSEFMSPPKQVNFRAKKLFGELPVVAKDYVFDWKHHLFHEEKLSVANVKTTGGRFHFSSAKVIDSV